MDLVRLGILYVHLISCCVAIGVIAISDIRLVRDLLTRQPPSEGSELEATKTIVSRSLVALWVSGLAIICLDVASAGLTYFLNPKLQAKIAVAALLTLNGFILHAAVLPAIQRAGTLLDLTFSARMLAVFSGAFSGVSWAYAATLGIGRPLSWKYSLGQLLLAYPLLIGVGFIAMALLTSWASFRSNRAEMLTPAHGHA